MGQPFIPVIVGPLQALDEIQAGIFDGWTYEHIAEKHPDEYTARKRDKLRYR
jgi:6-phosphofructo-2-kinase/fructose-2,6-biphosphatase